MIARNTTVKEMPMTMPTPRRLATQVLTRVLDVSCSKDVGEGRITTRPCAGSPRHLGLRAQKQTAFAMGGWEVSEPLCPLPSDLLREHSHVERLAVLKDGARVRRISDLDHDVEVSERLRGGSQQEVPLVSFRVDLREIGPFKQRRDRRGADRKVFTLSV